MRRLFCGSFLALLLIGPFCAGADDFKPEPGFTPLFNGKDLSGWKMATGGASLDGKAEAAKGRFKVSKGILVIDPKVKGDIIINTAKKFDKDVTIRFDFFPGEGCNNDLFFRGLKFDLKKEDVKNIKFGEWNEFEIVVRDGKAAFKCNGETQREGAVKGGSTPLGLRAELGPVQIRRLRYKEGS